MENKKSFKVTALGIIIGLIIGISADFDLSSAAMLFGTFLACSFTEFGKKYQKPIYLTIAIVIFSRLILGVFGVMAGFVFEYLKYGVILIVVVWLIIHIVKKVKNR